MPAAPPETPAAAELRDAVDAGLPAAIADLSRLTRIPSVSWDGFDPEHVAESAREVARLAERTGVFERVDIVREDIPATGKPGHPAVIATRAARNGKPTVLLYAHHDVQPPGDDAHWISRPFEPTIRDDRLFGRGTGDDKAGIVAHLAAIRALVAVHGEDFDLGIVLFAEGEEEMASPSLGEILRANHDRLASDVIVVADGGNWDVDTPALTIALRGVTAFNLRVSTLGHAVHSGGYGGAVPDAMLAAIRLLATLWNDDGSVAVPGLASHAAEVPEYDEQRLRAASGLLDGVDTIGTGGIASQLWYQPTITVTGMDAPSVQNASNTLIPSVRLRISARVAPGQSAQEAFHAIEAHLLAHAPHGARLSIEDVQLGDGFLVDADGWAAAEALATMTESGQREAVQIGAGGSIPFVADLAGQFPEAQVLITAVKDPDSRAHGANESLHLPTFHRAVVAEALLLARLDARQPAGSASGT